ncbi:MAG TPA: chitobiase/beta-hexosaminidase C-terminal domain-containing protein, partial [Opitutales bacterium]|nr:chitobiase/beta-hexosaminidase C-terminal domain-containing protein [Opitutales bacterium]
IRYTLDGSEVTADSPIYRYPLILQPGQVLTARAMRDGYADSQVISRTLGTKIDAPLGDPQLVGSGLSGHSGNFAVTDPEKPVLYYSFQSGVFRFEPDLGTTLVAGDPFSSGYKNGEGLEARFSGIEGLVADQEGNIFLIDSSNRRIRKITPDHFVSTLAGNGNREIRDGSGEEASFDHPSSLIIDETGTLYLLDSNHLRSIHPTGEVSTLFSLNVNNSSGFYEDGPVETARFRNPVDLARDAAGNFYILDSGNRAIRKLDREGIVSTVAPSFGQYLSIDRLGNIYTMDRDETKKITPNGFIFTITWPMQKSNAHRITLAEDGRIFTLDSGKLRIFKQLDFDGDGIPDELETEGSGLTLGLDDSRIDSDGDGWTNSEEFLLGTNPLNADSRPSINVETATDGTTIIRWTSLPERIYQVEFSDDLQNWFALAYDLQGTDGEMTVIDPEKLTKRFYRVRAFYDW